MCFFYEDSMRLNNNLLKDINTNLILALAVGLIPTFLFWAIYTTNVHAADQSFIHFFSWYFSSINTLLAYSDIKNQLLLLSFCVLLPLGVYICVFAYIVKYLLKTKAILSDLHIKHVDLLEDKICFEYSKPEYNFECKFSELKKVHFQVILQWSNGTATVSGGYKIGDMKFYFTKNDDTTYSISTTPFPLYAMSYILKIVDYFKINGIVFSYEFIKDDGKKDSNTKEFEEKIANYISEGRYRLSKNDQFAILLLSQLSYIFGLGLMINFKDNVANFPNDIGLVLFSLPIIISAVLDVGLLLDKNKLQGLKMNYKVLKHYNLIMFIKIIVFVCVVVGCFI